MSQQQTPAKNSNDGGGSSGATVAAATTTTATEIARISLTPADIQNMRLVSDTLKRNPKLEFSRTDLLKLLCFLEGELQARDVVIAALKSDNLKQLLCTTKKIPVELDNPHAALFRDHVALAGNVASRHSSAQAVQCEQEIRHLAERRLESLQNLISQQRQTQMNMVNVLKNVESKQKRLVQELDEERRKHDLDTAQGDDITYGLELERTRLKQELETERTARKKLEKDAKKLQEQMEAEQARQKQIVLFLLVERKKIIMKYVEERKRSEDLAQICAEEKLRVDSMAEGLEEESKKSLQMEAELEKQAQTFARERDVLLANVAREEKKVQDQEVEIRQLKEELELLRKQIGGSRIPSAGVGKFIGASTVKAHSDSALVDELHPVATNPLMKVVQPTAIVSSVPVCGPTTGIAKSVVSGQVVRPMPETATVSKPGPRKLTATISDVGLSSADPSGTIKLAPSMATAGSAGAPQPPLKKAIGTRVPPPIPPNKPAIPLKRDSSRIPFATNSSVKEIAAATASVAVSPAKLGVADATEDATVVAGTTVMSATHEYQAMFSGSK